MHDGKGARPRRRRRVAGAPVEGNGRRRRDEEGGGPAEAAHAVPSRARGGRRGGRSETDARRLALVGAAGHDDHRGKEPVASPGDGLHVARGFGVVVQGLAHLPDRDAEAVVELDEGVGRPELPLQLVPSDDLARPLHEQQEEAKGQVLQPDPGCRRGRALRPTGRAQTARTVIDVSSSPVLAPSEPVAGGGLNRSTPARSDMAVNPDRQPPHGVRVAG